MHKKFTYCTYFSIDKYNDFIYDIYVKELKIHE